MAIDPKLLHILRCPVTKQKLKTANDEELELLNQMIANNSLQHSNGTMVEEVLRAALVTENRQTIYKITAGIPVMLEDQSIPAHQIENW